MTEDDDKLHEEAEEIRDGDRGRRRPSLPSTTASPSSRTQLEEANAKALYAAAEIQNVRRRLEQEKQQASAYAAAGFARDMLAIKDHLERALVGGSATSCATDKTASQVPRRDRGDCARARVGVRHATGSRGSSRSASRSTRTSTRR